MFLRERAAALVSTPVRELRRDAKHNTSRDTVPNIIPSFIPNISPFAVRVLAIRLARACTFLALLSRRASGVALRSHVASSDLSG